MKEYFIPLFEMLMQETKDTLLRNARLLDINIPQRLKKAEAAGYLSEFLLTQPLRLLDLLPFQEVLKLQKMVHSPEHSVTVRSPLVQDCISIIGLTDFKLGNKFDDESIYSDLAEALSPVIDAYVNTVDFHSGKIQRETIITGLLNMYGILTINELFELSCELDHELTRLKFMFAVNGSYLLKGSQIIMNGVAYHTSPFLNDAVMILKEIEDRKSLKRIRFPREDVMKAGDTEIPQPPSTPETNLFRRELLSKVKDENEVNWWLTRVWMTINNDRTPMDVLSKFMQEYRMDEIDAKHFISIFLGWGNNAPRWIMKGNNSKAVFEKYEKPRFLQKPPTLVMGPNARKAGISFSQEEFNKLWENNIRPAGRQVGRNDTCPCGSGKKFKQCCGKFGVV